jgi:hypothetical protein
MIPALDRATEPLFRCRPRPRRQVARTIATWKPLPVKHNGQWRSRLPCYLVEVALARILLPDDFGITRSARSLAQQES